MGALQSKEFAGDPKLEACAVSDPAHVTPGSVGSHVGKIQSALIKVDGAFIDGTELAQQRYGASTTQAVVNFKGRRNILNYAGQIDNIVGKKTIRALDDGLRAAPPGPAPPGPVPPPAPPGPPKVFVVHDVRLFGWKPFGDVLEVNGDTPLQWMLDNVIERGKLNSGNVVLKIMAHGLPGFVQCCRGAVPHPTLANKITDPAKGGVYIGPGKSGIGVADLKAFEQLKGYVQRIEFHSCLVARIGPCFEANGHACYDGNALCFQLAQATGAEVVASIHVQWYWKGSDSHQMHFGDWNGLVFTWGPAGNIIGTSVYPYTDMGGPPPPGTAPL
ncbi:MAG: peptidoglycan-binding domain-containing protein [Thermoanaerobaculia bacterium]